MSPDELAETKKIHIAATIVVAAIMVMFGVWAKIAQDEVIFGTAISVILIPYAIYLKVVFATKYKRSIAKSNKVAEKAELLSEFHSEGLINESDYEKKKREILDDA